MAVRAGGIRAVDPLYQLESGVTLLQPFWFMIYYIVILLFLGLAAASERCTQCGRCTSACPMSLPVDALVQRGDMEHAECILCANCVDACPRDVIQLVFRPG